MECLPDLALLEVFKYLSFRDLISISFVSSRFKDLASSDALWKYLCKEVWLLDDLPDCSSWKAAFMVQYQKFGKYVECYSDIKSNWNTLEKWLLDKCPKVHESLNPGIDEEVLLKFETDHKIILPSDLKLSYMLHNGQRYIELGDFGLFGGILLPTQRYLCASLNSFELAISKYSIFLEHSLPVTSSPILKLATFQVVKSVDKEEDEAALPNNSKIVAFDGSQYCQKAASFSQWFSEYTNKLTSDQYFVLNDRILLYDQLTEVKAVTQNITVSVRWAYDLTFNAISLERNLYSYIITMSMSPSARERDSCKLLTRHWEIDDRNGTSDTVDGDGVVGNFPVMRPGAEFTWTSCTSFQTERGGSMKGHFRMQNLVHSDQYLNVVCPEFVMKRS